MAAGSPSLEAARAKLEAAGQGHALRFVDEGKASPEEAQQLVEQVMGIDFEFVNSTYQASKALAGASAAELGLEPVQDVQTLDDEEATAALRQRGLAAIAAGEIGAIVLAGGQGTRLGFDKPKGEYDVGLASKRTLLQVQAERLKRLCRVAEAATGAAPGSVHIPWYIMTSPMTHAPTVEYVESQAYFGLPVEDVFLFQQGTLPCLTDDGKVLLESRGRIATAPDGNGGIYRGLHSSGAVADMKRRGVKYVHVYAVDNLIVKVADPVFMGQMVSRGADVGSKVCPKTEPGEKVGVLCRKGGAYCVAEYSDMSPADLEAREADGSLRFSLGNLCIHAYSIEFLEGPASPDGLPSAYHIAHKKIPHADDDGNTVAKSSLTANTGLKLESFIFDVFTEAKNMAVLQVDRAGEFSPVKNAPGAAADTPESAKAMLERRCRQLLEAAGAAISGDGPVEFTPAVSYDGEGLEALAGLPVEAPALVCRVSEGLFERVVATPDAEAAGAGIVARSGKTADGVNVYALA